MIAECDDGYDWTASWEVWTEHEEEAALLAAGWEEMRPLPFHVKGEDGRIYAGEVFRRLKKSEETRPAGE